MPRHVLATGTEHPDLVLGDPSRWPVDGSPGARFQTLVAAEDLVHLAKDAPGDPVLHAWIDEAPGPPVGTVVADELSLPLPSGELVLAAIDAVAREGRARAAAGVDAPAGIALAPGEYRITVVCPPRDLLARATHVRRAAGAYALGAWRLVDNAGYVVACGGLLMLLAPALLLAALLGQSLPLGLVAGTLPVLGAGLFALPRLVEGSDAFRQADRASRDWRREHPDFVAILRRVGPPG